jgi:phosphatidylglycerophosphatase A
VSEGDPSASGAAPSDPSGTVPFLFVTAGGLGLAPFAPGTFGSLGGVALAFALGLLLPAGWPLVAALLVLAALLFVVGCGLGRFAEARFGKEDPGAFVLDEVVGQLLALAAVLAIRLGFGLEQSVATPTWLLHLHVFVWFRICDILKPWPAWWLQKRIRGGLGVMLDDVAAGLQAGVLAVLAVGAWQRAGLGG